MIERPQLLLPISELERILVWFSCGAASAVAAKKTLELYPEENVEVLYCDTLAFEHPDNRRFLADVEQWLGRKIKIIKSEKFSDIFEVFLAVRFLKSGPSGGAPCTKEMKIIPRKKYSRAYDRHVFGFTSNEQHRIKKFEEHFPDLLPVWVLRDAGLTKQDCYRVLNDAGIKLPVMYQLGYKNNNCVGCVKGGMGYWNKIRRDFPAVFDRMAKLERELSATVLKKDGKKFYLDELDPSAGRYQTETSVECGVLCQLEAGKQ
jgi:3'-phosphoadenosine 5'-phosphosulfate sulfotransferase (PAPS reductase)/FAD synthetase